MIEKKDVKKGEYYIMSNHPDFRSSNSWIIQYKYDELHIESERFHKGPNYHSGYDYFKEPSFEQIRWLKACQKAGKAIPLRGIKSIDNYTMY